MNDQIAAPGRVSIESFVSGLRDVQEKEFVGRYSHPFLLQLNESNSTDALWRTTSVRIELTGASSVKPLFVYTVKKRAGANPFAFVTIGRAANNDLVLPYPSISKFHASLASRDGKWTVTDADSSNGTGLDGTRIPGKKPTPIQSGSLIELGGVIQVVFLGPRETWEVMKGLRSVSQ